MAEELDGLEGIGDLDDEFGDQLDSFMDSEGGDDGELDSFFEDLSTIDDLEVQDDDLSAGGGDADDLSAINRVRTSSKIDIREGCILKETNRVVAGVGGNHTSSRT